MTRLTRFRRDEEGAAVVEFGFVVPILLLIVFAIVDFGRAYHTLNNLTSAVREGARFGAVLEDPASEDNVAAIKSRVTSFAYQLGGDPLQSKDVTVTVDDDAGMLTVSADYTFVPITPLAPVLNMSKFTMTQTAVFRLEFASP